MENNKTSFQVYVRLLQWVLPYTKLFIIALLGFMIFATAQPMLAYILKYFVDNLTNGSSSFFAQIPVLADIDAFADIQMLYAVPVLIAVVSIWQGTGSFLGNFFISKVGLYLVNDLRQALFNKLLRFPNGFFDNHNSGHLVSRIVYDTTMVTDAATNSIKVIIREGFSAVFLFISLMIMNWKLTLVMLGVLPIISVIVIYASKKFRKQSKRIQTSMGDITHVASENIKNYKIVKIFNGHKHESEKFAKVIANNTLRNLKLIKTSSIYVPIMQFIIYSAMAFVLFLVLLFKGNSSVGELVAYITIAGLLPKPMKQLSEVNSSIQRGISGAASIFEILDQEEEKDNGVIEQDVVGKINFININFGYITDMHEHKYVLHNISFEALRGEVIALVGKSGGGKSTIANLLPRFYDYADGKITIDDIDIKDYTLTSLRHNISIVSQQVDLFNDTIYNNICYPDAKAYNRELVIEVARAANCLDFIEKMDNGFDTLIGENGVLLSGGQRQRLAIARALLKRAPILILDEATSALDNESEKLIQNSLQKLMYNATTIVIAHRLSTIEKADKILVIEQGKIVEIGTHLDLLQAKGRYASLHAHAKHNMNAI